MRTILASLSLLLGLFLGGPVASRADEPRPAPELAGDRWLNGPPLHVADLRGKVVLVEFWAFACENCQNVEPYVKAWHSSYAAQGLVVIGVHCPELDRERDLTNLKIYLRKHEISYPVLVDNGLHSWRRYANHYWPTRYLIDKQGRIRHERIGEGGYEETEAKIRELIAE